MKENYLTKNIRLACRFASLLLAFCLAACSDDDNEVKDAPFDPNQEVQVTSLNPTTGSYGQRLVIWGSNFGNDPSMVNVTIGGVKAIVINVKPTAIYCLVPIVELEAGEDSQQAVTVEIVRDGERLAYVLADPMFDYTPKQLVSTLCGSKRDDGNYEEMNGPFDNCGGFGSPNWLEFDPKYPYLLYVAADMAGEENQGNGSMRVLDLKNQYAGTALTQGDMDSNRGRSIAFFDDDHMAVARDQGSESAAAVMLFERRNAPPEGNTTNPNYNTMWSRVGSVVNYKQCNTVTFHPVDGDMYFNSYERGQFYRVAKEDVQAIANRESTTPATPEELFSMDRNWEYSIRIHPSGDYAYIVSVNQHYIQRTNYNWTTHRFVTPYVFVGTAQRTGWTDAVGSEARFNKPYQGVFVYNPEYAAEGQSDCYDFYICDKMNHCIRIITPQGSVTTFAGRGSSSLNADPWGFVEGDLREEARFDRCKGLAYDQEHNVFYVGDGSNRRIRMIAYEYFDVSDAYGDVTATGDDESQGGGTDVPSGGDETTN